MKRKLTPAQAAHVDSDEYYMNPETAIPHPDGGFCDPSNSIFIERRVVRTEEVQLPISDRGRQSLGQQIDEMMLDAAAENTIIEDLHIHITPQLWDRMMKQVKGDYIP